MESHVIPRGLLGPNNVERLDAEYFYLPYWRAEADLASDAHRRISDVFDVNPPRAVARAGAFRDDEVFTYVDLDSVELLDGLVKPDDMRWEDRPSRARHLLNEGDLLISNVRPERGIIAYVGSGLKGAVASSGFTLLRRKAAAEAFWTDFCFLFLRTELGRAQLVRRSRGSMYPAVLPRDIANVLLPMPTSDMRACVGSAMNSARQGWRQYNESSLRSRVDLTSTLTPFGSLPSIVGHDRLGPVGSTTLFSEMRRERRIDAEYHRPEFEDFATRATRLGAKRLGSLCSELRQGRAPAGGELVPTFRQGVLTNVGINWAALELESGSASVRSVREGDVLLASMAHEAHYLGRKADVVRGMPPELAQNNQATHHLTVIRPKPREESGITGSYLAAFLTSELGMRQVQRCNRGVRGDHVSSEDLAAHVLVPIPDASWLDHFESAVLASWGARNRSIEAIGEAVMALPYKMAPRQ